MNSAILGYFSYVRFEVLTVMIHIIIFWIVMLYSDVVGYHHFGVPCCLHLEALHLEDGGSMGL
jgi:hypothetical protein